MEDWLSSVDEWLEKVALVVFDTLLVDVELHLVEDFANKISCVLQTDRKSLSVSCVSEEVEKIGSIGSSKSDTIRVVVPIDVIGINRVTTFAGGNVNSSGHNGTDICGLGIEPPLVFPALKTASLIGGLEVSLIWAPVLKTACGKVTDNFFASSMKSVDGRLRSIKEVKVENIGRVRGVSNNTRQLDLPCGPSNRLPQFSSYLG